MRIKKKKNIVKNKRKIVRPKKLTKREKDILKMLADFDDFKNTIDENESLTENTSGKIIDELDVPDFDKLDKKFVNDNPIDY